jgi:hypothetical protein
MNDSEDLKSQWCLIGNIVAERPYGHGGLETKHGTKHFSPGAKVYCFPVQWGDGYEHIMVIGVHRGSKKLVTMVIDSDWVEKWRAKVVYQPAVLRQIKKTISDAHHPNWESQEQVEEYVRFLSKRHSEKQS